MLSIGRLIADGATNIIPPTVEMEGTLRTMDETWRGRAKRRVAEIAAGTAAAYGVEAEVKISDGYPCVVNDPALTARARQIVGRLWGADRVEELALRMTAEDFGSYTKRYPSVFSVSALRGRTVRRADCTRRYSIPTSGRSTTAWRRWPRWRSNWDVDSRLSLFPGLLGCLKARESRRTIRFGVLRTAVQWCRLRRTANDRRYELLAVVYAYLSECDVIGSDEVFPFLSRIVSLPVRCRFLLFL